MQTSIMPIGDLAAVKKIIVHANCPDGIASAILLHDALPNAKIEPVRHGTDHYHKLAAEPGLLFCDIAPPADRVQEFVDVGSIVLDHHKSARSVVEAMGSRGVFADESKEPGVSGAMLAFREVWYRVVSSDLRVSAQRFGNARRFAELAGIRDTFVRGDAEKWREACAQAEMLLFYPTSDWLSVDDPFSYEREAWWQERMKLGHFLLERNEQKTRDTIRESFRGKTAFGHRYLICQNVGPTTDVGATTEGEVDIVIGFRYYVDNGTAKFQLSARSQGVVDVGAIAKRYGGGGHTNAAGWTVPFDDATSYNPILTIVRTLEENGV